MKRKKGSGKRRKKRKIVEGERYALPLIFS